MTLRGKNQNILRHKKLKLFVSEMQLTISNTQQSQDVESMLVYRWLKVGDDGPTLRQH